MLKQKLIATVSILSGLCGLFYTIPAFAGQGFFYTIKNNSDHTITTQLSNLKGKMSAHTRDLDKITIMPQGSIGPIYVEDSTKLCYECGVQAGTFTLSVDDSGVFDYSTISFPVEQIRPNIYRISDCLIKKHIKGQDETQFQIYYCYGTKGNISVETFDGNGKQYNLILTIK